jgi:hypothetical protein
MEAPSPYKLVGISQFNGVGYADIRRLDVNPKAKFRFMELKEQQCLVVGISLNY